jgi:hypothetical protein
MALKTELSFQAAVERFKEFLSAQGHSTDLLWIFREDVLTHKRRVFLRWPLPQANERYAETHYEAGRDRGLGLKLEVFCWAAERACCYVLVPEDEAAADSLMMTELRFSCPVEKATAMRIRTKLLWLAVSSFVAKSKYPCRADLIPEREAA